MSVNLTIAGTVYAFPTEGEEGWGSVVTQWATAVSQYLLQRTGGTFTLSAEVDFGATFATKQAYLKSRTSNPASAGFVRLARADVLSWRNEANSANLDLSVDSSNRLLWAGDRVIVDSDGVLGPAAGGTGISSYTAGDLIYATGATTLAKLAIGTANYVQTSNGSIPVWALLVNANIDAAAAIAYSKLNLSGSIVNADVNASAAIAYSKLNLSGGIVNADVNASAAIARSKIAVGTADHVLINAGDGSMSSEATLAKSRGGAGADMTSVTFPSTGTLATLTATQAFTNKTFSDAVTGAQIATPSVPAAGFNQLYFKSDNSLYSQTPGGVETAFATSSSGEPRVNWIINGAMDFWQRSIADQASIAGTGTYGADRFKYLRTAGANVVSIKRSTDIPTLVQSGFQASYSFHVDVTTADAAVAAGDLTAITYTMEGYEWGNLQDRQVTVSFWVKATKTGTSCIAFRNSGSDRSYVAEFTINSTATWEQKTVTLTLNPSGGTNDYTSGAGLQISWCLIGGSTFQTTASSWQTGNFLCTSSQVNHMDSTSNDFRLALVSLNIGSAASSFQRAGKNISNELQLCQRYYQKSYNVNVDPGVSGTNNEGSNRTRLYSTGFGTFVTSFYSCRMRTPTGTVEIYSPVGGAAGFARNLSTGANLGASELQNGEQSLGVTIGAATVNDSIAYHWKNDCDF